MVVAALHDQSADEVLSVEVEIGGRDAARLRAFAERFGYGSLAVAIVALVGVGLDNVS
jgi:hypothetical protein